MILAEQLQPAHLGWRIVQSFTDDLLVTACVLLFAGMVGLLPDSQRMVGIARLYDRPLDMARALSQLIPAASLVYLVYWVAKMAYQTGFLTLRRGQTPGCWLFGVQVVMKTGDPVTWQAAAGRTLAGGVMGQVPVVGQMLRFLDYVAALFNKRRQAVRDMAVGTMLVHTRGWWVRPEGSAHG